MYSITFMPRTGALLSVSTPSLPVALALLPRLPHARLWLSTTKGQAPVLLG